MNVTGIYLTESCKKSNDVSAEKIQRFVMVQSTLTTKRDLSFSWNIFASMYVFICHRWKIVKDLSFSYLPIDTTKVIKYSPQG